MLSTGVVVVDFQVDDVVSKVLVVVRSVVEVVEYKVVVTSLLDLRQQASLIN